MLLEVRELELHPIDFEQDFRPGEIEVGPDFAQKGALKSSGRAQLVEEHRGKHNVIKDIRLDGKFAAQFELSCARCLEPVVQNVDRAFDLLYRPLGVDAGRDESSVTGAESEISYYGGEGILLEDVLREQVLLALPLKVICRQDCKGLCPQCGANLNAGQCSCTEAADDPRWTALKDLRGKLEH